MYGTLDKSLTACISRVLNFVVVHKTANVKLEYLQCKINKKNFIFKVKYGIINKYKV